MDHARITTSLIKILSLLFNIVKTFQGDGASDSDDDFILKELNDLTLKLK